MQFVHGWLRTREDFGCNQFAAIPKKAKPVEAGELIVGKTQAMSDHRDLPGDSHLPPGATTQDTDGPPSEHTCPKCGSSEVSDLHTPDLWCANCDHEWDARKQ
jgi:hypothetical protein